MEAKLCYGCMNDKQVSPVCEHCGYDERTQNAPHQLPAGTVLQGKYLLGRVLGQGGFGITYLGRDIALDIPVAIKEYYPTGVVTRESAYSHSVSLATGTEDTRFAENRDRFLREARTLARLEDVPEVVQVKSFFTENNTAYIVMGYVKGITLKEHMRRSGGKLSPSEVFRLLEPVLEALGQVHELGLVHRDISPDNIMLQPNKRARLIDFGAAHTATLPGGTSTQAVLKHGFAPVEQYQSKGHLGSWTDVYAMCATIYHCITGLMPPNATDRIMGEEDFQWDALSCLTEVQQAALRHGLELNYKQRIQTMEELCAKLFSGEEPAPQPKPIPRPEPVPQPKPTPMPEPKPQPKPEEPSVSETGTVELVRKNTDDIPTVLTAPVVQKEPAYTAPVQRPESYTAAVEQNKVPVSTSEKQNVTAPEPTQQETASVTYYKKGLLDKGHIIIAAAVVALALLLLVFLSKIPQQDSTIFQRPEDVPAPEQSAVVQTGDSRILMNPEIINIDHGTWLEVDGTANFAFGTKALRHEVSSITFLDSTKDAPVDAVDASEVQDGSVLAWVVENGNLYDLYIAANGKIIAPADCYEMFACYSEVTKIDFNNVFVTDNVTNMGSMFWACEKLTNLDLSGVNTQNVTDMGFMFTGCSELKKLDLSGFDTGKVETMNAMFNGCYSLAHLDVSGFDTGNVWLFGWMFSDTNNLKNVDGHFDVGNAVDYECFMDPGDTFNGRPWKELFQ